MALLTRKPLHASLGGTAPNRANHLGPAAPNTGGHLEEAPNESLGDQVDRLLGQPNQPMCPLRHLA